MPQLDANTFIYQYFSLILVFLVIYVLLSYAILPIILRAMFIRNSLLSTSRILNDVYALVPIAKQNVLSTKNPMYFNNLVEKFLSNFLKQFKNNEVLMINNTKHSMLSTASAYNTYYSPLCSDFFITYVVIMMFIDTNKDEL